MTDKTTDTDNADVTDYDDGDDEEEEPVGVNPDEPIGPGNPPRAPEGNDRGVGTGGGAPRGNDHAVGGPGGDGAPPGNKNAMDHGLYAVENSPGETFEWLEKHEPENAQWVKDKAAGYLEEAPFGSDSPKYDQLLQIATAEYAIWQGRGIQIRDGLVKKTHKRMPDGQMVEVEDEHPVNKPVDRMENRVTQRLNKLGIFDDQEQSGSEDLSNEYYTVVNKSGDGE